MCTKLRLGCIGKYQWREMPPNRKNMLENGDGEALISLRSCEVAIQDNQNTKR